MARTLVFRLLTPGASVRTLTLCVGPDSGGRSIKAPRTRIQSKWHFHQKLLKNSHVGCVLGLRLETYAICQPKIRKFLKNEYVSN